MEQCILQIIISIFQNFQIFKNLFINTHLKLCLADASHNFKWVKII